MFHITNPKEHVKIFQALASPVRIEILELLNKNPDKNINELASAMNITSSALTAHIKLLSDCGLINVKLVPIRHGTQKLCSLAEKQILVELMSDISKHQFHELELNVGQYTNYKVNPTCGLGTYTGLIGDLDGPQYFAYPQRYEAEIVWYTDGYITYTFPNPLSESQHLEEIQITMEISSEAPGAVIDFPTNIDFYINDIKIGRYICPGELFDRHGRLTPAWWQKNFGQYGRLRILTVNSEGTLFNGEEASNVKLQDLGIKFNGQITLKISCEDRSDYIGGITLFGKRFGDHPQGIRMRALYTE
jgi:predicted transcriptional regulator